MTTVSTVRIALALLAYAANAAPPASQLLGSMVSCSTNVDCHATREPLQFYNSQKEGMLKYGPGGSCTCLGGKCIISAQVCPSTECAYSSQEQVFSRITDECVYCGDNRGLCDRPNEFYERIRQGPRAEG